jgi:ATP-binding cassette, subfamily B, bacterial
MRLPFAAARSLLLTYLRPQRWWVAALGALLLGSIALQLVAPQVLRGFIDVATGSAPSDSADSADPAAGLTWRAALFMVVAILQQVLAVGATFVGERVGWTATNGLRADLARHCLALDLGFHKQRTPGELIERIDGDVTDLADFFSLFVLEIVANILLLTGVLLALWLESWLVALPYTVFVVLALTLLFSIQGLPVPHWRAFRQASAELFGFLEERLGGTEDIRASGAAGYVMHRLYERTRARYQTGVRARLMNSPQWTMPVFIHAVGTGVVFCTTAFLFAQGTITLGTAFLIYAYAGLSFRPLRVITREIEQFQKASAALLRIGELLRTRSTLPDGPGAPLPPGALAVAFQSVAFGYGEHQMVLDGITFRLQPGAVLGLLGRTGSGKTTLARLLFRLYDPAAGTISLGGGAPPADDAPSGEAWVDLRQPRLAQLRSRVAMVTQDVQLFRATVRDNVTLFDAGIEDARIEQALDDLGLAAWRRALPQGLDTVLGGDGAGLSAGEGQLLAFTRAFLRDPGLVVLDEASSRLDPATERLIERAVGALLRGRTAIIIAHRLGTVQRADGIMILEGGRIVEHGPRQALAADPASRFSSLLRSGMEQVLA